MKSGELITADGNSIANQAIQRVIIAVAKLNKVSLTVKVRPKTKGDDSYMSLYTERFTDQMDGQGSRIITYSDDAIKDFEFMKKVISLVYKELNFEANVLKGGFDDMYTSYLKKFFVSGYIFYNRRFAYFVSENAQNISRTEKLIGMIGVIELLIERGADSCLYYDILMTLVIISFPIKLVKNSKAVIPKGKQEFISPLFISMFLSVDDGGINFPFNTYQMCFPNSSIVSYVYLMKKTFDDFTFLDLVQYYRAMELNRSDNRYVNKIVNSIINGEFKAKARFNFDIDINFNKQKMYDTLNQGKLANSIKANTVLEKLGIRSGDENAYYNKLKKYLKISLKSENLHVKRQIKYSEYETMIEDLGKLKEKKKRNLTDYVLSILKIEYEQDELIMTEEHKDLVNIAMGSGDPYKNLIDIFGYVGTLGIAPFNLRDLQRILNKDTNGPRDVKADVLISDFMRPEFLFSEYNMSKYLEKIGFNGSLASEIIGELVGRSVYYHLLETKKGMSPVRETTILSNIGEENIKKYIVLRNVEVKPIQSILYSLGLFLLVKGLQTKKYNKIIFDYDTVVLNSVLSKFGYGM